MNKSIIRIEHADVPLDDEDDVEAVDEAADEGAEEPMEEDGERAKVSCYYVIPLNAKEIELVVNDGNVSALVTGKILAFMLIKVLPANGASGRPLYFFSTRGSAAIS